MAYPGTWRKVPPYDGLMHFEGLASDADNLPKKADEPSITTGASAFGLSATGADVYHYEETTDAWYKL